MFLQTTAKMSEFMTINLSHFGCTKSAVLTGLRQTYSDGSCPGLGIGIKISDVSVSPSVIDPVKARPYPSFFKKSFIFYELYKSKEAVFTDL